jgi:uncharacterized membrane protein
MGLQEVHPSIVHWPLALAPLSVGADLAGVLADDPSLVAMGRATIGLAAASAGVAAVTGLIAQEEVRAEGIAHEYLVTHRNLNLVGGIVLTGMALWRRDHDPGPGYLALGAGVLGTMFYTAYLGGKMVYDHGVGVKAADGVRADVPELRPGELGRTARTAASDVGRGARNAAGEIRHGELAPALRRHASPDDDVNPFEQWDDETTGARVEAHPPIH